jgi:hypothetical protein
MAIAVGALSGVTGAPVAAQSVPSVAVRGDKAYVAWAADGIVQTATMKPNGAFAPGVGIGTAVDTYSPQLAVAPLGDQLLLWRSQGVLRSAFRAVGPRQPWKLQTVATHLDRDFLTLLATDPGGRAIAVWSDHRSPKNGNYSLLSSTRPAGGEWSRPASLADDVNDVSMASDSAGDVVVTYLSRAAGAATGAVAARMLPVGAGEWTPVTRISGADAVDLHTARVTGGGVGTFLAGWEVRSATTGGSVLRSARLRLPGGWSAPQSVLPEAVDAPISSASPYSGWGEAVDGLGTAVALVQFPKIAHGSGIAVTHLPAAGNAWTAPVLLGQPAQNYWGDARGSLVLADDGSTTFAFARSALDGATLRLATTRGPLDAWQGQDIQIGEIHRCGYTSVCGRAWGVAAPVMAIGSHVTAIALQSGGGTVFAFTRTAPDGTWTGPIDLVSAGATTGRLLGTHVRKGAVRATVSCSLPPCKGVVALRAGGRLVGGFRFSMRSADSVSPAIALSDWARARLAQGRHLVVRFTFTISMGDGGHARSVKVVRLLR